MISDWMTTPDDLLRARNDERERQMMMLQSRDERGRREWDRNERVARPILTWDKLPEMLIAMGAPDQLSHWTMGGMLVDAESTQAATAVVMVEWIKAVAAGDRDAKAGCLLVGSMSSGKTALAVAAMRMAVRKQLSVQFYAFEQFIELFKRRMDLSTHADQYADYGERMDAWLHQQWASRNVYDILVLDDIGRMDVPTVFKQEVSSLVRARFDAGRHTIVTTNMSTAQAKQWDDRLIAFMTREFHVFPFTNNDKVVEDDPNAGQ